MGGGCEEDVSKMGGGCEEDGRRIETGCNSHGLSSWQARTKR